MLIHQFEEEEVEKLLEIHDLLLTDFLYIGQTEV
jgi:hypothetical protein